MLDGLHEHEDAPEDQRHKADALELQNGIGGARSGLGEVRQDQRQRRQSPEHGERGGRALQLEGLLEVLARPEDEAETDNAVEHDHHRREHRVPRDALAALGPGKHDRDDEPGFDHRHRDREQDRAKRLAKLERQHLGVMDGGEHRGAEEETGENKDISSVGGDDMGEFQRQQERSRASGTAQVQAGMEAWCGGGHRSIPLWGGWQFAREAASHAIRRL